MKLFILLSACALMASAYYYTIPPAPCAWKMTREIQTINSYEKEVTYARGSYFKQETYDYDGNLISATVYRPDYATFGSCAAFYFDGLSCSVSTTSFTAANYYSVLRLGSKNFQYVEEGEFNGKKCRIYYDNYNGVPDKNYSAVYVDSDGYVIGRTSRLDDPEMNTNYTYSYGTYVPMSEFTFSRSKVYACSDERIFSTPSSYYSQCSASTTGAVFAVVVAAIASALVSLF